MTDDLTSLREQISAIDRELLDALNRRLELVRRVREHKQEVGAPTIDAQREAELLRELVETNRGPLSERGIRDAFSALLDVMKQEARGDVRSEVAQPERVRAEVASLAVIGTGLVGTSVALAARRAGVGRVVGWDEAASTLREASRSLTETAASLSDAVAGVELVVVAVPVGSLADTVRAVLAAAGTEVTVTDVGSTKRGVATIEDARLVPGHPLAGGATGGPARASADLFDAATWFVCPNETSDPKRIELLERSVSALGARSVRLDAETHDRLLAVTSHLPHALANLLVRAAASAGEDALAHAGASLREMTRVAGANADVWTDIFVENADAIAEAVAAHADEIGSLERALRERDRDFFERWIAEAADARNRMLAHAYRTDARTLQRIRVRIPDKPGVLARITQTLGAAGINIEDFELRHVSPEYGAVLVVLVAGSDTADLARTLLRRAGYSAA